MTMPMERQIKALCGDTMPISAWYEHNKQCQRCREVEKDYKKLHTPTHKRTR